MAEGTALLERTDDQQTTDGFDIQTFYSSELSSFKTHPGGYGMGLCPFHNDTNPSFRVDLTTGDFKCFSVSCGKRGTIVDFQREKALLSSSTTSPAISLTPPGVTERKEAKVYSYNDESGNTLFQSVRYEPKGFSLRQPDRKGGWIPNIQGVRLVPYNLPEVVQADTVFIVEGEKDVETLRGVGLVASCNPMGAGKWRSTYNGHFLGKKIVILPDNDEPGREHALQVARNLKGIAESVKVIELQGLPEKGDVSDWIKLGGIREKLLGLIASTPEWKPKENAARELIRLSDLLVMSEENPTKWVVDKMLPAKGFSLVVAKPKVGKSTLAQNLALCVARGEDFLGRKTVKGPVMYYAIEELQSEVGRQFLAMGTTKADDDEIIFHFGSMGDNPLEQIRDDIRMYSPSLVIIDPLFRAVRIQDENSYAEVTRKLEPLLMLARETGIHLTAIHHTPKIDGGDGILGSTAIFGTIDTRIKLTRSGQSRTISTTQKYGPDMGKTPLLLKGGRITIGDGKNNEKDLSSLEERIVEFLSPRTEPVPLTAVLENVRARREDVISVLNEAESEGRVDKQGSGKAGDPFRYVCSAVPAVPL